MNTKKLDQYFKDSDRIATGSIEGLRDGEEWMPKCVFEAPLFIFDDLPHAKLLSKDNTDVSQQIYSGSEVLPFNLMRLYVRSNREDFLANQDRGHYILMRRFGARLGFLHIHDHPDGPGGVFRGLTKGDGGIQMAIRTGSLPFCAPTEESTQRVMIDLGQAIFTSIAWFIREAMSPANRIASVTPKKQGKSVEWLKSRTHYVIVDRHHPANAKTVAEGASVAVDERSIQRMAHTRRAHARVLRSPRFRHKIGQIVMVKSCWVGPKQWEQSGSIYRLINHA
jgi:hypothetical protein